MFLHWEKPGLCQSTSSSKGRKRARRNQTKPGIQVFQMASSLCPSILTGLEMTCPVRGPSDCLKLTHKATVTGITAGLGSRHWKCQKAKGVYGRCHWGLGSSCNVCRTNNKQSTRKWPTWLARWRQGWVPGGGGGKEEQEEKTRKGPVSHLPSRAMGTGNLASFTELSVHLLPTLHVRHR